jgi:preprotein translocase subunit SecE
LKKIIQFIRESRSELKKVSWPSRDEVTNSTMVVIGTVIVSSLLLWGMDSILFRIVGAVLKNG